MSNKYPFKEQCYMTLTILHADMYEDVDPETWHVLFVRWMEDLVRWVRRVETTTKVRRRRARERKE